MFYKLPDKIYLDGNSLGLLSTESEQTLKQALEDYKAQAIDGWTKAANPWFTYAEELAKLEAPLIGAGPEELIIHASTTINLHVILASFFKPVGKRYKILIEEGAYPTDRYAVMSHLKLHGLSQSNLIIARTNSRELSTDAVLRTMRAHKKEIALVLVPAVSYRIGELLDVKKITTEAHRLGMLICIDASHSAGVVPHSFSKDGVDFAVFCNYKYVSGGPGAPASLYINRRHFGAPSGLAGWWGSDKRKQFDMTQKFMQAKGAGGFQTGTPHIFSMAPLKGALEVIRNIGIKELRKRSLTLTDSGIRFIQKHLSQHGIRIITPLDPHKRGGHIAIEHPYAAAILKALDAKGVIVDFRAPNTLRFTPVPLYTTRHEFINALQILKEIFEQKTYRKFINKRRIVA